MLVLIALYYLVCNISECFCNNRHGKEVAVAYYRYGYSPKHYIDKEEVRHSMSQSLVVLLLNLRPFHCKSLPYAYLHISFTRRQTSELCFSYKCSRILLKSEQDSGLLIVL